MYQYLINICSSKLRKSPVQLGGPGIIIQIDESLFNHTAKYNSMPVKNFGMADTSHKPAITYIHVVDDRKAETRLPIIQSGQSR